MPGLVIKQVVPKLLQGMQAQLDVATACLDIMNDVVGTFGHLLTNEHGPLKAILVQKLVSSKAGFRKRAMACLGAPSWHACLGAGPSALHAACYAVKGYTMQLNQQKVKLPVPALQAPWCPTCPMPCWMRLPRTWLRSWKLPAARQRRAASTCRPSVLWGELARMLLVCRAVTCWMM